jgi:hypothetical protein
MHGSEKAIAPGEASGVMKLHPRGWAIHDENTTSTGVRRHDRPRAMRIPEVGGAGVPIMK